MALLVLLVLRHLVLQGHLQDRRLQALPACLVVLEDQWDRLVLLVLNRLLVLGTQLLPDSH